MENLSYGYCLEISSRWPIQMTLDKEVVFGSMQGVEQSVIRLASQGRTERDE